MEKISQPSDLQSICTSEAPFKSVGPRQQIENLDRPALDDRSYCVVTLPNQLEVLLIHDANTDKAGAALDVNVGSFSDPKDMPGTAHAVEHMLSMGTEKVSFYACDIGPQVCHTWISAL